MESLCSWISSAVSCEYLEGNPQMLQGSFVKMSKQRITIIQTWRDRGMNNNLQLRAWHKQGPDITVQR